MATITSVGSGLWSAAGTWDAGVPADNDVVVIAAGHVVEFDVDQSGFANGIDGITITGTLSLTRTAGTYYLKIKAAKTIGGAGVFDCGTLVSPIPFAAKHTITGGTGWYIKGNDGAGLTMTVYAAEPAIKTVLLTGAESAGETVLEVDTDVTSDIWADGDTIRIDNVNAARNSEARLIAAGGIAAGAITITAGLTAAKIAGTRIHLVTRNVRFLGNGGDTLKNFLAGKLTIAGGEWTANAASYASSSSSVAVVTGGVFHTNSQALAYGTSTVSGGVFLNNSNVIYSASISSVSGGTFSGNTACIVNSPGVIVSGGTFSGNTYVINNTRGAAVSGGTFTGNAAVFTGCAGLMMSGGTITANNYGVEYSSATIKNASFSSNAADLRASIVTAYNTLFASTSEHTNYTELAREIYSESIDHDQTAGAFRAWTKGGVTSSQAVVVPTGITSAMQTVLGSATSEGYWQKEVTVTPGASVNITMHLRKDGAMAYLPRCIVFSKASADPFAGGAGLHTFTMTNSVDTWESDTYTYTNSGSADVTLVIRFQGMAATGNVFSELVAEVINVDLTAALASLAAIKAKTDNLPSDPADESLLEAAIAAIPAAPTAVQVRQEIDANSTKLDAAVSSRSTLTAQQVWEYVTRTLTGSTLTAQQVWEYATRELTGGGTLVDDVWAHTPRTLTATAAQTIATLLGNDITFTRGDTWSVTLTGLGNISAYVSLDFTVKTNAGKADTAATLRIRKNASGVGDGLLILNGAAGTPLQGTIAIDDAVAGDITITLAAAAAAQIEPRTKYYYDIQMITATTVQTLTSGELTVVADFTRAVS